MKPINGSLERIQLHPDHKVLSLPPIERIVGSPLLRHLAGIHISEVDASGTPLENESLALLAQHAPYLTSLWCELTLTPDQPLVFPCKLTSLNLALDSDHTSSTIDVVLLTLALLPSLSHLCIRTSVFKRENTVEICLLADSRSLTSLDIGTFRGGAPTLTCAQQDQMRSSLGHLHRFNLHARMANNLARLLQPPVTACWQDIGYVEADEHTGQLLVTLQTLTRLDVYYTEPTAHLDFLPQLPLLRVLVLDSGSSEVWYIRADALLASLVRCICVTELNIHCGFNSAHFSALFAKLPLKKLTIRGGELETLQCFAAGPITQSLDDLSIRWISLPPSELSRLYPLRRLRTLHLDGCFSARLSDAALDGVSPPTPLLPALTKLLYLENWTTTQVERRGASFEWMQQRLTQ